jgi:DNA-binding transcriptional regulator YiaG
MSERIFSRARSVAVISRTKTVQFCLHCLIAFDIKQVMTPSNIVKLRKQLGLTQRQLAEMIGAYQPTVARWERRKNRPRGANLKALQELQRKAKQKPN